MTTIKTLRDVGLETIPERISWSGLSNYLESPAKYLDYLYKKLHGIEERTAAFLTGGALHCRCLEPDEFDARYAVGPRVDRRTRKGKAAWEAFAGKHPDKSLLDWNMGKQLRCMAESLLAPDGEPARILARCGHREEEVEWTDAATGRRCHGFVDARGDGLVVDVKTSWKAAPETFRDTALGHRYHGQAAFYWDGLAANGHAPKEFHFLVVNKNPPYRAFAFPCDDAMLQTGRDLYRRLLDLHQQCVEKGEWPDAPTRL